MHVAQQYLNLSEVDCSGGLLKDVDSARPGHKGAVTLVKTGLIESFHLDSKSCSVIYE
jgi:hypothetical protein